MKNDNIPDPHKASENQERTDGTRTPLIGARKLNSFWDPLYAPSDQKKFPEIDWLFENSTGARHATLSSFKLQKYIEDNELHAFKKLSFEWCLFRGEFTSKTPLAFQDCDFYYCDFGYALWERTKFSKCKFRRCSFTLTDFNKCEFIDCEWIEIGINGTETRLSDTLINNPKSFIESAYTNTDPETLNQFNANESYQKNRLELSKAKIARILKGNLEVHGDDRAYYESVGVFLTQNIVAQISECNHNCYSNKSPLKNKLLLFGLKLELAIIRLSGLMNSWGRSIARPAIIGLLIVVFFGLVYYTFGETKTLPRSLMAAYDVTVLVGYTKHAAKNTNWLIECLYATNALFGLWWYAVFVPTVINRISRIR